jgi:TRAP-type C4-dicarboxylate transport system permease small subunit
MNWLTALNTRLSRWVMYLACASLVGLVCIVDFSVVKRYGFNDSPVYAEQVALLLVISVAMFGAAAGVRDVGHIGLDSLVEILPLKAKRVIGVIVGFINIIFAGSLLTGCWLMAHSTYSATIPTLGISEAFRYVPPMIAGILIILFSIEHQVAAITKQKVIRSWH